MPRKFSIADKKKWLEKYESGKSEVSIATESKCDARTVKKGIEEARRELDAQFARTELLKNALLKHQDSLLDKLRDILSTLTVPPKDWVALSWYRNGDSIFSKGDLTIDRAQSHEVFRAEGTDNQSDIVQAMLEQHLRNDKLWKVLAQREKAYASHRLKRITLQHEVAVLLQKETGYKMVDRNDVPPPFLYAYTAGDLFFKMTLRYAFGDYDTDDWQGKIVADTTAGCVMYHPAMILAEVPGKEKKCRQDLLEAFKKMRALPDLVEVVSTFRDLEEATLKARQVVEEIRVLGLIPGHCQVCRRLGM
jgi:hypothetical protein